MYCTKYLVLVLLKGCVGLLLHFFVRKSTDFMVSLLFNMFSCFFVSQTNLTLSCVTRMNTSSLLHSSLVCRTWSMLLKTTTTTKTSITFRLIGISDTCQKPLQVSCTCLTPSSSSPNTAQELEMEERKKKERLHEAGTLLMYSLPYSFLQRFFLFNHF